MDRTQNVGDWRALVLFLTASAAVPGAALARQAGADPAGTTVAAAAAVCEGAAEWVQARGHQDVQVELVDGRFVVRYEDRVSRQPLREALAVGRALDEAFPACAPIRVAGSRHASALPVVTSGRIDEGEVGPGSRRRGPRIDLQLEWSFRYSPAYTGKPSIRTRHAIVPEVRAWWPFGLHLVAQYAIPVGDNNFPGRQWRYFDSPYVDLAAVGYRRTVGPGVLVAGSLGLFTRNRYGLDLQAFGSLRRLPVVIGGRIAWTGYWGWQDGLWGSSNWNTPTAYLDLTAFLPYRDLRVRARAGILMDLNVERYRPGEYLEASPGVMVELARRFGELEIGFTGFANAGIIWPGIRLALPLAPKRGVATGAVAAFVDPVHDVPWDFGRVVRGKHTSFIDEERGDTFYSGFDLWAEMRHRSPWSLPALARRR